MRATRDVLLTVLSRADLIRKLDNVIKETRCNPALLTAATQGVAVKKDKKLRTASRYASACASESWSPFCRGLLGPITVIKRTPESGCYRAQRSFSERPSYFSPVLRVDMCDDGVRACNEERIDGERIDHDDTYLFAVGAKVIV